MTRSSPKKKKVTGKARAKSRTPLAKKRKASAKKPATKVVSVDALGFIPPCPVTAIPAITDAVALRMENGERLIWDNTADN